MNERPHVFSDYDPPPDVRVCDCSGDVEITKQSFKDSCDINLIMERATAGAIPGRVNVGPPMVGDFTDVGDYLSAQIILARAREAFAALPSRLRERFANDPAKYLAFMNDPKNTDEAISLGIAKARPAVPPVKPEGENK